MSIATAYSSLSFLSPSTTLFSPHHHYHHHTSLLHLPLRRKPFTVTATTTSLSPLTPVPIPIPILDFDGNITGETFLTLKTAPPSTARAVVHRAIITDQRNARRGTASTLTRAEVRGGGKKPYRQKKTGRARRGSQTTPLRRGGGVIFGPKPKDWSIKINRKEKKLAMGTAIASAVGTGVLVVEEFGERFERPRTKEFVAAMRRWGIEPAKEKAMFMMMEVEENVVRSGRNVGTVRMVTPRGLNLFDVLNSDKLVFTRGAVEYLNATYGVIDYDADEDEDEEDDDGEDEEGSEEGESSEVVE